MPTKVKINDIGQLEKSTCKGEKSRLKGITCKTNRQDG